MRAYSQKSKLGYTLVEMVIVVGILIMLLSATIRGLINSQRAFIFNNAVTQVSTIVREARSLAVTGKAQIDYTDYDRDEAGPNPDSDDSVTPANYGIFFENNPVGKPDRIILFADINKGESVAQPEGGKYEAPPNGTNFGVFVEGRDVKLAQFEINKSLDLVLNPPGTTTVLFSPIFADTTFYPPLGPSDVFFVFGVKEINGDQRKTCFKIHSVAGVPEVAETSECL